MPGRHDPLDVALRVAAALERVGAVYFVGGSVASSLYGEPRSSNDIDFVVDMPLGKVAALATELGDDFEVDVDMLREAVRFGRTANLFYLPSVLKIDIFGHPHGPFDEVEFSRSRRVRIRDDGATLVLKSPEDTILRKLLWYRQGGEASPRQLRDVDGVLRANAASLDFDHLSTWAARIGVSDLLDEAVRRCEDH